MQAVELCRTSSQKRENFTLIKTNKTQEHTVHPCALIYMPLENRITATESLWTLSNPIASMSGLK